MARRARLNRAIRPRAARVRRGRTSAWLIASALLALCAGSPARAQVFTGVVVEAGTDTVAVRGALVELVSPGGGRAHGAATTGSAGEFRIRAQTPGEYRLRISRIGYLPVTTPVHLLAAGDSIHQRLDMPRAPVAMDTIRVETTRRLSGFQKVLRRQRENNGIFIPGAIFDAAHPAYPAEYLQYLIGTLFPVRGGGVRLGGSRCTVIWIDEWRGLERGLADINRLEPRDIRAIEIYRTFRDVPDELKVDVYPCGLINIWTRVAW